jgi:two-component system osmolarity sensor histidine kinase EnvZ
VKLPSPSLFWRTFLLLVVFLAAALVAWLQSFRVLEREPRARQIAQQVVSIVNITRAALLYSDPEYRSNLLVELAANEGIRITPLEADDVVTPFPDIPIVRLVSQAVTERLGPKTRIAAEVDGIAGFWVSFDIDGDAYWVFVERDPLTRSSGTLWVRWAVIAMLLSVLAALAVTRVVNRPLGALSRAARDIGAGQLPAPLPEHGPVEIRAVNRSFNQMVGHLAKLEQDRALLLAGISHDLRTPLTRLRLEVEVNALSDDARAAMIGDIEQMDAIVGQFLDYARPTPQAPHEPVDLTALVDEALAHARLQSGRVSLERRVEAGLVVHGHRTELARALDNLLTNALRHGADADSGRVDLQVTLARAAREIVLTVADRGPGIAPEALERVLRPFERGDAARAGPGAGLGLAIVERIAQMHGGRLSLAANAPHGLRATLHFPAG